MTVCIAAICKAVTEGNMIVGASDRLITYGDTEYEQAEPKILQLASNTVALISGSPEDHVTIRSRTLARTALLINPTVEQIAGAYADEFATLRRQRAEKRYLIPLGLSAWTFLNNQTNLAPETARKLMEQLAEEDLDSAAIITGVDQFGAHIYGVDDPGEATCYDLDGWAAIGSGWRHADLQFISDKYHRDWPFDEAFLLAYLAKKKADITPGVGTSTDLFWIVPGPGGYVLLPPEAEIVTLVRGLHDEIEKKATELGNTARKKIREYVQSELEKQRPSVGQEQLEEVTPQSGGDDNPQAVRKRLKKGQSED